ncbi:MAG: hypothetical protein J7L51_03085 [Desulfurococcales archaeon]|nr:hypothetical protein [Desulfurococcales archaeon]
MEVRLIGFDSLGVRSMASVIYTDDVSIFIDPAVSLAPWRFSLKPHPLELKQLECVASKICEVAKDVDVIVLTHYHYDHHDPGKHVPVDIYEGKDVIIKDPRNNINVSQRIRASRFLKLIKDKARNIIVGDGREFTYGKTKLLLSKPVPHGVDSRLGYVTEVLIDDGDYKIIHTSDVEGPVTNDAVEFILNNRPDLIIIDGPPTYLVGHHFTEDIISRSISNLARIVSALGDVTIVLDHHLLRDLNYREFYSKVIKHGASTKARVMCAAEFMGMEPMLLEARRKELYSKRS